jgi:kynurenine formamidase
MRIVDLTHPIREDMPVYPGTASPRLERANTLERDGFRETLLTMVSHTGTHMDAPAHMRRDGATLDRLAADRFVGPAVLWDVSEPGRRRIEASELEAIGDRLPLGGFLILRTGWSRHWGKREYFEGFPCLTEEAARWLGRFGLKGVGVDAISVDPVESTTFDVHGVLFERGEVILENLTHLEALPGEPFLLAALPLRFVDADGSPVRAVAILDR